MKTEPLHQDLHALGEGKTTYKTEYDHTLLEKFPNPQTRIEYKIDIVAPEVTCRCPKTAQPDFATFKIFYIPAEWCVESKSLKLYLGSFRETGIFHEAMTNVVAEDLYNLLKPVEITVKGEFNPRGGISFWPTVTLRREDFE